MAASDQRRDIALTIPPKAEYLVFCRLVLVGIARAHGIDDETLADLKLAVTEACSNSIRHAYGDGSRGDVEVRYEVEADRMTIEVADDGPGFDLEPASALRDELDEEGMGIAIIRGLVDELVLDTGLDGGGSRLRLTKYFP